MAQFSTQKAAGSEAQPPVSKLITRLVNMRVVKNMTTNGKIARFSAVVVAGNGHGGLGCGHAKHNSAAEAVTKAGKLAVRSMEYFSRWQDRTLFHDDYAKFKASKVYVRPAAPSTTHLFPISSNNALYSRLWSPMSPNHR